jgi:predicted lipoprotein with Yx(FWY)xxD motif
MGKQIRNKVRLLVAPLVVVAALAAVVASAQGSPGAAARVSVRSSEYGKVLFGPSGKVLYVFSADRTSTSRCYGACAAAWPPLLTSAKPLGGPGIETRLLGTTKRRNGTLQATYNGHPLYYYVSDTRTKIMCQHANMHGGLWFVVKPNGQPNRAKASMHT